MDITARHKAGGKTMMSDVDALRLDLKSGDTVRVSYLAADGVTHVIDVTAQHMILLACHEGTDKAIVCRPGSISTVN